WASPPARRHAPAKSPRPSKEPMRSAPTTMATDGGPAVNEVLSGHSRLVWEQWSDEIRFFVVCSDGINRVLLMRLSIESSIRLVHRMLALKNGLEKRFSSVVS